VPDRSRADEPAQADTRSDLAPGEAVETAKESTPAEEKPAEREEGLPGAHFADPMTGGGSGPIMVWLARGEFQMGSPPKEPGRNLDERLHLAHVPEPLAMSETEITLGQFRQFAQQAGYRTEVDRGSTCLRPDDSWQQLVPDLSLSWESPGYPVTERHPVACISWNDARAYADWLAQATGQQYRLPTELEWEYAARAGTNSSRFWGDDPKVGCTLANTAECKDKYTYSAPAGTFAPNPFGLRDVLGNVAEWTCSEYEKSYSGTEARCSETAGASPRVFRGGSWLDAPDLVRSAARDGAPANIGFNTVGFRLVRTLPRQPTEHDARTGDVAGRQ
jgi:formylglycine-generating enzyme required for sulfatase activity